MNHYKNPENEREKTILSDKELFDESLRVQGKASTYLQQSSNFKDIKTKRPKSASAKFISPKYLSNNSLKSIEKLKWYFIKLFRNNFKQLRVLMVIYVKG